MIEPTLYVMVGLPGSGKSTYAQHLAHFKNIKIVSTNAIREQLYKDATIQGTETPMPKGKGFLGTQ